MNFVATTLGLARSQSNLVILAANSLALALILKALSYRIGTIIEQRRARRQDAPGIDSPVRPNQP